MDKQLIEKFRSCLKQSRYLGVLTGAGISAESGIPTFRGAGGLWKQYEATQISSPKTWQQDPGLIWEFFNFRRHNMLTKKPNPGHYALTKIEEELEKQQKTFSLITQNIDDLHLDAGSKNVTRLHGSIWQVRCIHCNTIFDNRDVPITVSYKDSHLDTGELVKHKYKMEDLPKCSKCSSGILRPHVVWFGEMLAQSDISQAFLTAENCDLFLVVGTSCVVNPAAQFINIAKSNGAKVAIVNLEPTPMDMIADFLFYGKSGEILPEILQ